MEHIRTIRSWLSNNRVALTLLGMLLFGALAIFATLTAKPPPIELQTGAGEADLKAAQLQAGDVHGLVYQLDRSNVPRTSFPNLTLEIRVGAAQRIAARSDGASVAHSYDPATGVVTVTSAGNLVELDVTVAAGTALPANFGAVDTADFLNGRNWAWSHGFDDNVGLFAGIDVFERRGWQGSLYLIGSTLDPNRDEPWIVDEPAARRLLRDGWSLGGHGWTTTCDDHDRASTQRAFDRLQGVVAASGRSGYEISAFAAPCFVADYHPVVLGLRDEAARTGSASFQFNESGNDFLLTVGAGAGTVRSPSGTLLTGFDPNRPIGRDIRPEFASFDEMRTDIDWIARQAANGRPIWYNSLTHGNHEDRLEPLVNYVFTTYGPGGNDSVWVAPADEIFAYVTVRDATVVTRLANASPADVTLSLADALTPTGPCASRRWDGAALQFRCE